MIKPCSLIPSSPLQPSLLAVCVAWRSFWKLLVLEMTIVRTGNEARYRPQHKHTWLRFKVQGSKCTSTPFQEGHLPLCLG